MAKDENSPLDWSEARENVAEQVKKIREDFAAEAGETELKLPRSFIYRMLSVIQKSKNKNSLVLPELVGVLHAAQKTLREKACEEKWEMLKDKLLVELVPTRGKLVSWENVFMWLDLLTRR